MGKKSNGEKFTFPLDCNGNDFDRNIQNSMYRQMELNTWGIFYEKFNKKEADAFFNNLQ